MELSKSQGKVDPVESEAVDSVLCSQPASHSKLGQTSTGDNQQIPLPVL